MNKLRTKSKFLNKIVVVAFMALLVLVLFTIPGSAATKVLEVRQQNINFTTNPGTFTICGTTDTFTDNFHIGQSSVVLWSNGRFVITFNAEGKLFDSAGNLIARQVFKDKLVTGEGFLPLSVQSDQVITCAGNSGTPGKFINFHFGFTIGEDGMFKEFHFVFN